MRLEEERKPNNNSVLDRPVSYQMSALLSIIPSAIYNNTKAPALSYAGSIIVQK